MEGPKKPYNMTWNVVGANFLMTQAQRSFNINFTIVDQLYDGVNQVRYNEGDSFNLIVDIGCGICE